MGAFVWIVADETVGVFVGSSLPGAVGVSENASTPVSREGADGGPFPGLGSRSVCASLGREGPGCGG